MLVWDAQKQPAGVGIVTLDVMATKSFKQKTRKRRTLSKRKIYEKKCFKQEQEGKKVTGLSIDVIKNQIRLSKMFAGSEAVSTKALKELLEYKETGLTPQDIKDMDKMYLEKCQQVNRLTCTCEMYERMAKHG